MGTRQAVSDLKSVTCHCGAAKPPMNSHCRRCYFALPQPMRRALYKKIRNGYEEAYQASCEYLDEMKSKEISSAK